MKTLRTTQSRRISEGSILPLPGAKFRLDCGLRMLPFRRHICLPCSFDLFLLIFPGQIFRFPAMIRAGRIPVRAATAGVIPVVVECFCHFIPPLGLIPGGSWLKTRRARSLPAVSLRMGKKGRSPRQGVAWPRWRSIPDSNRRDQLGRLRCCHYINAPYNRRLPLRRCRLSELSCVAGFRIATVFTLRRSRSFPAV